MTETEALHAYWDGFYAGRTVSAVPEAPSPFAQWVAPRLAPGSPVAELGFGTARDSFFFAGQGHPVLGFDFAESAVAHAQAKARHLGAEASFTELDLYDASAITAVGTSLAEREVPVLYGRFLMHSLEAEGRANLLDLAQLALAAGGELYLEFRTGQDAGHRHLFGEDHYRAYLDPDEVVAAILDRGGSMVHVEAGHGLAVYKTEDPHVARLVARFG